MNRTCRDAYTVYLQHASMCSAPQKVFAICNLLVKLESRCVTQGRCISHIQLEMIHDLFEAFLGGEKLSEEHQLKLMCHVVALPIGSHGTEDLNLKDIMSFVRS